MACPIVSNLILVAILSWNSLLRVWAPKRAIYESWLKLPLLPVGLVDNKIDKGEYDDATIGPGYGCPLPCRSWSGLTVSKLENDSAESKTFNPSA